MKTQSCGEKYHFKKIIICVSLLQFFLFPSISKFPNKQNYKSSNVLWNQMLGS